jgi:hypothetical protein
MMYENLSNEELLKEVYLTQHKDRLLTLVCERLEMVMRELADALEYDDEVARLNEVIETQDEEIHELNKRIDDLVMQLPNEEF